MRAGADRPIVAVMAYHPQRSDDPAANPPPLPGEKGAVDFLDSEDRATDADVDFEVNELHAAGQTCVVCQKVIGPTDDVRRHLDGTFQHEICPQ